MGLVPHHESAEFPADAEQEVLRISAVREVQTAIAWLRANEPLFTRWQIEAGQTPAPPFGETPRADWLQHKFVELGLDLVQQDEVGNVLGLRGPMDGPCIALSAHIDTVFPATTPLNIRQQGTRLYGPGVSDNGAGLTAMLAVAAALQAGRVSHQLPILFIGNVGEEGEGDLRGMRHIFAKSSWKERIAASLILDGAGADTIVAEALGSRRYEVIMRGAGGHSWSDFGTPNPILGLARALHIFRQTPIPSSPKTTFNVGVIRGGTSVNSIPESASMRIDVRSTSMSEIERLETALRRALDKATDEESQTNEKRNSAPRRFSGLSNEVIVIGNRPAGDLRPNANILKVLRAVDSYLGNTAQIQRASTDANIPLSLGREALAIGGGGTGGGAHTLQEWFDSKGRELGLKRILLTVLGLARA